MGSQTYNAEEIKLFNKYQGLKATVEKAIAKALEVTDKAFGMIVGPRPRAYCRCLNGGYIAMNEGKTIAREIVSAHEDPKTMSSQARADNIHNGFVGINFGASFFDSSFKPSPAKSADTSSSVKSGSSATSSNISSGEAASVFKTDSGHVSSALAEKLIAEKCLGALKDGSLRLAK